MRVLLALFLALGVATAAHAAPPPVEVYGRLPSIDFISLSPSGDRFALAARLGEDRSLLVRRVDGQTEVATKLQPGKVRDLVWGGDRHLFVFGSSTIRPRMPGDSPHEWMGGAHLDLVSKKAFPLLGASNTYLSAFFGWYGMREVGGHAYAYVGAITQEDYEPKLVLENDGVRSLIFPRLVRIDLENGHTDPVAMPAGGDTEWLVGPSGQVLLRAVTDSRGETFRLFPGAIGGAPLLTDKVEKGSFRIDLEGLGRTPDKLLLWERSEDDVRLREVSISSGEEGEVLASGDNTATGLYDRETHLLIGLTSHAGDEVRLFDPAMQKKINDARAAWPGLHSQLISYGRGFNRMIFLTDGKGDAGTYWLVDIAARSAIPMGRVNPDIPAADVGDVQRVDYKAADGLAMDGVLTLPPGREPKNLPLVVLPHGGPIVPGDKVQFDWWAQAFASRGYAVFQPNYRGTLGRGEAFRKAAFGQFGRKMQTDISDGVDALAKQGLVDPKRACIVGGSYGGYAALAGVTVEQGRYRCAVSVAGIGDLAGFQIWVGEHQGTDMRATSFWRELMGASAGQDLKDISPQRLAARADAPILLIHGVDDTVVPIEQSQGMERALKSAGKPVDFVTMPGEDHWLSREATRQAMLNASVAFVQKYNPAN
jgi:dipeptidyl aminopeptidase/acylaminoacyl peptidase